MSVNRAFALAKLTFRVPKGGEKFWAGRGGANVAKTYIRRSVEGGCLLNSDLDLKFQSLLKSALYGHVIVILTIPILIISPHSIHSSSSKIANFIIFIPSTHPSIINGILILVSPPACSTGAPVVHYIMGGGWELYIQWSL